MMNNGRNLLMALALAAQPWFPATPANEDAAQGKLLCHGEYSTIAEKGKTPQLYDKWSMYAMPDGSYAVDVELVAINEAKIAERRGFTPEMKPKSLQFSVSTGKDPDPGKVQILCNFGEAEVACQADFQGRHFAAKLQHKQPYLFFPLQDVDVPVVDMAWSSQMLVVQAARIPSQASAIPLISIDDKDKEQIRLVEEETVKVEYLGQETIEILNRKIKAHKFKENSGTDDERDYWLSGSGLLLKCTSGDFLVVLSNYQGPPLE